MERINIDKKTVTIITIPPVTMFLITLLTVYLSRNNLPLLSQIKSRANDQITLNFLNTFNSYEEFLNFIVPEGESSIYCSGNFYTSRGHFIDVVSTQDGNAMLRASGLRPDSVITNEDAKSFIEMILSAVLENRDDSMSHFVACDLWALNIDSNEEITHQNNNVLATGLNRDMLKEIYDYLESFSILNYGRTLRGLAEIAIRFEYQSREPNQEPWPNNTPQITIDVSSWTHGFTVSLADLDLPYRDLILTEIFTKVSNINNLYDE